MFNFRLPKTDLEYHYVCTTVSWIMYRIKLKNRLYSVIVCSINLYHIKVINLFYVLFARIRYLESCAHVVIPRWFKVKLTNKTPSRFETTQVFFRFKAIELKKHFSRTIASTQF